MNFAELQIVSTVLLRLQIQGEATRTYANQHVPIHAQGRRHPKAELVIHSAFQCICKGGGLRLTAANVETSPYLEPNRNRMQKPIEGLSVLKLFTAKNQSAYKGGYTTTVQQNKHNPFPKAKIRAKQKHIATRG
jgi:hypothetical protein